MTEGTGDLVLVRIGWNREVWSFDRTEDDAADPKTVPMVAIGLARCEIDLCGQTTS